MGKKRTVLHSKAGKKLYAVRDQGGQFSDIQTYQRAQSQDMKRTSQAELTKKAVAKKSTKKKASKKKVANKKSAKKKSAKKK